MPGDLEVGKLGAAEDEVEVAFDEAGQQRRAAAVDHLGRGTGERLDVGPPPHRGDPPAGDGDRLGARLSRVHGQDAGVGEDHLGGHGQPLCGILIIWAESLRTAKRKLAFDTTLGAPFPTICRR